MIRLAEQAVSQAGLSDRVTVQCERFEALPGANVFDAVLSNSLLHHLPNPLQFWNKLRQLVKPGSPVLVMDLLRPDSPEEAQAIVDRYASGAPAVLRRDFFNSLMAAFTEDEVTTQLARMNLTRLLIDVIDNRHWWSAGRSTEGMGKTILFSPTRPRRADARSFPWAFSVVCLS